MRHLVEILASEGLMPFRRTSSDLRPGAFLRQQEKIRESLDSSTEARVASRWKVATDVSSWVDAFFRRHPRLKPYLQGIRRVRESSGGSGSHGEARQTGDDILLFPKFWTLHISVQDFVFAHEIGHWVLASKGGSRGLIKRAHLDGVDLWDTGNLPFGQHNMEEGFADSFASYFVDGDVQRRYPLWSKWVEAYL